MNSLTSIDILGVLGFLIAGYTFVRTQLVKPNLMIVAGPSFSVYYTSDGGAGMYLPIAYINEGDRTGKIISTTVRLALPSREEIFTLRWADFVNYDAKNRGYTHLDHARAFSVPGQNVVDKFIWFVWRSTNDQPLNFKIGDYSISIMVSTSIKRKATKTFEYRFTLTEKDVNFLNSEKLKQTNGTRTITFKNHERENIYGE